MKIVNVRACIATILLAVAFPLFVPAHVHATALLSEDLRLHIPWVEVQGRVFSLDIVYDPSDDAAFFSIADVAERTSRPPAGASATVDLADLTLRVPLIGFGGHLYSAVFSFSPRDGQPGFVLTAAASAPDPPGRGQIVSVTPLSTFTREEISATYSLIGFRASHGVSLFKVLYMTADAFGKPMQASGLMAVPLNLNGPAPLLSYQHGTLTRRDEAPSAVGYDIPAVVMAASGYVVSAPDYLGFGGSSGLHPFVHAKTLSGAVIDMMRALRSWCSTHGINLDGRIFLAGYSEGGYATMAAQREIETLHAGEFAITASAPAAGPYDLSGTMLNQALSGAAVPNPYYLPFLLLAYNGIYGLADSAGQLLAEPYAGSIPPLFDGNHGGGEINGLLPLVPRDFLSPQIAGSPGVPETAELRLLRTALRENDAYRWTPRSKTRLYHCTGDRDVPYENAVTAYSYFVEQGAPDVQLITPGAVDHRACALPAFLLIKSWFDSLSQ